eukprot:7594404-Lingulodinium_polyedra.AAC.1
MDQAMNVWRAFSGFEDQTARCWAADYADAWFSSGGAPSSTRTTSALPRLAMIGRTCVARRPSRRPS